MQSSRASIVEVEGLSKRYGPVTALDGVSFRVEEGEILGFLGPNGAGKTTTLRILAAFLPGDSGRVSIAGMDVAREPVRVRSEIGYLPEGVPLYPELRVEEYLRFRARIKAIPFWARKSEVERVLEAAGIQDVRRRVIGTLSRGYRQRVGLADALLGSPRLLILDEPTVGLDPEQVRAFREVLREVGRDRTVILSTHILSEVELVCSRVLIIRSGRIVASDTPEGLRSRIGGRARRVIAEVSGPPAQVIHELEAIRGVTAVELVSGPAETARDGGADGSPYRLYTIYASEGCDVRESVYDTVSRRGWKLRRLELREEEPTLEDVFIHLVKKGDER